jgi:hypothetical protein
MRIFRKVAPGWPGGVLDVLQVKLEYGELDANGDRRYQHGSNVVLLDR